jgi:hypothetical protein
MQSLPALIYRVAHECSLDFIFFFHFYLSGTRAFHQLMIHHFANWTVAEMFTFDQQIPLLVPDDCR